MGRAFIPIAQARGFQRVHTVKIRNSSYEKELEEYETMKDQENPPKYPPRKFGIVDGSKKSPSLYGNTALDTLLVLESELDAILIVQEAGDLCFCLALGGSSQPLDLHTERLVRGAEKLLFCPDFDKAGAVSWGKWKKRFPDAKQALIPYGKDPTEAFAHGVSLREWIEEVITNK